MDELCESFVLSTRTVDGDEIDILDDMIENLENISNIYDLRNYMNHVSYNVNRYYFSFVREIHKTEIGFKFLDEIKKNIEDFMNSWAFYKDNESKATPNDLEVMKNKALDAFGWIKMSINENKNRNQESDSDSDEYGDLEYDDYNYDEYENISRDYEDIH